MNLYLYVIFAMVSFLASVAGAICGIGGGVRCGCGLRGDVWAAGRYLRW